MSPRTDISGLQPFEYETTAAVALDDNFGLDPNTAVPNGNVSLVRRHGFQSRTQQTITYPRSLRSCSRHPVDTSFHPSSLQQFMQEEDRLQKNQDLDTMYDSDYEKLARLRQEMMSLATADGRLRLTGRKPHKKIIVERKAPGRTQIARGSYRNHSDGEGTDPIEKVTNMRTGGIPLQTQGRAKLRRSWSATTSPPQSRPSIGQLSSQLHRRSVKESTSIQDSTSLISDHVNENKAPKQDSSSPFSGHGSPVSRMKTQLSTEDGESNSKQLARLNSFAQSRKSSVSLAQSRIAATAPSNDQGLAASTISHDQASQEMRSPGIAISNLATLTTSMDISYRSPTSRRSLSFEKHASEQRRTRRTTKTVSKSTPFDLEDNHHVDGDSSPRLRKKSICEHAILSLDAKKAEHDNDPSTFWDASDAMIFRDTTNQDKLASTLPAFGFSADLMEISANEQDTQHAPKQDQLSSPGHRIKVKRNPVPRVDKDTFLTASSDEQEFDDTDEIGLETSALIEENEQEALRASLEAQHCPDQSLGDQARPPPMSPWNWKKCVPESLPLDLKQASQNRRYIWRAHGLNSSGEIPSDKDYPNADIYPRDMLRPSKDNILEAPDRSGDYPRKWKPRRPPMRKSSPPVCSPPFTPRTSLPSEIWEEGVLDYLSSSEVRTLRLVCKAIAEDLAPYVFRNVVVNYGAAMFDKRHTQCDNSLSQGATPILSPSLDMFARYGSEMNKLGIAFEYDEHGLCHAPTKTTETLVRSWFGNYKWPVKDYPYFISLKEIDDLLEDEGRLLTKAMKHLTTCSELALSVDSGHGWISGPDMSDLQLFHHRGNGGSKIFGKTFDAEDRWHAFALREYFKWAQQNTVNQGRKFLALQSKQYPETEDFLRSIVLRDYDSFRIQSAQPDFERYAHTGGKVANTAQPPPAGPQQQPGAANPIPPLQAMLQPAAVGANNNVPAIPTAPGQLFHNRDQTDHGNMKKVLRRGPVNPIWPIIFNCRNISADVCGNYDHVIKSVTAAYDHPLHPGCLTEAQAQWLMETSWIQRTFLSSYMDAVRLNSGVLKGVHSINIAKISSGLLGSLSQDDFWTSLPGLRKVTLFVKPDWREEHIPGDKFYQRNMAITPSIASIKLAELLNNHLAKLENLYTLSVGFVSGGEHQPGIFGRNQHVQPAPITPNPAAWVGDQNKVSAASTTTMVVFPHIRTLTFSNCWFSPSMLQAFMKKSKDSSLHHLILDSVSLTTIHGTRTDGALQTVLHGLKCNFAPSEWLQENVPPYACWVSTLDKITPGRTLLDRKYDADMIDTEIDPRPKKQFRGNIQQISLKSCGYVKISGISDDVFNQNNLVVQNSNWRAMDHGLEARLKTFRVRSTNANETARSTNTRDSVSSSTESDAFRNIMQASRMKDSDGKTGGPLYLLGRLTQCVHPIEKRILEHAWGMRFGWGDTMERFAAVDDGWFMGGTGRFSGEIKKDDDEGQCGNDAATSEHENENENDDEMATGSV